MTLLDVRLEGVERPVGVLASTDDGEVLFAYHEDYLAEPASAPISLSLPLQAPAFDDRTSRAFFQNLLPENDQLEQLIQREQIERGDVVELLRHLGADCAGALSCLPTGSPPVKTPGLIKTDYDFLDAAEIAEIVRRLANNEPLPDGVGDASPVAGVQRKIAVVHTADGRYALPRPGSGAPTTHILKVPHYLEETDAALEAAAARLVQACGLEVSIPAALRIGDHQALLVSRFDRTVTVEGMISRLHQEDFAQALGLPPRLKYQRNAGANGPRFDAAAIARVLAATDQPALSADRFIRTTLFNLAIGNTDNHAKNHALLYGSGSAPRLAPLYDLLPILLNPRYRTDFAFDLGAARTMEALTTGDLDAFFIALGLRGPRGARAMASQVLSRLDAASASLPPAMKGFDDLIGRQSERMIQLLGLDLVVRERDHFQAAGGGWLAGS